jgi:hypothetical protein
MEIMSAVLTAIFMACFYFLLFKVGLLQYSELYLAIIITIATTAAAIVTTAVVVKYVKR